ncbi:MAG: hypothetical protein HUJ60_02490, partial [Bacilli bacterium]|nr:hypothetical protein [Bacilli bacterium]
MKDFERFKKKMMIEHAVKSALVALGSGLIGAAIAIAFCLMIAPSTVIWGAIIAGVVFAGAGFAIFFIYARPSDKKIAMRVDKELGLQEKCATMIEYQGKEGIILEKQREDAKVRLAEKPTKALPLRVSIWVIPAMVIASGAFAASWFAPKNALGAGTTDETSSDNWDSITSSIVDDAKSNNDERSDISSDLKSAIDEILDSLQSQLEGDSDPESRSEKVDSAKSAIDS